MLLDALWTEHNTARRASVSADNVSVAAVAHAAWKSPPDALGDVALLQSTFQNHLTTFFLFAILAHLAR